MGRKYQQTSPALVGFQGFWVEDFRILPQPTKFLLHAAVDSRVALSLLLRDRSVLVGMASRKLTQDQTGHWSL